MHKGLWNILVWFHSRNIMIVFPHRTWKELINITHIHILLCNVVGPVLQSHNFPSFFSKNYFIISDLKFNSCSVLVPLPTRPSPAWEEATPTQIPSVELRGSAPFPGETIMPEYSSKCSLVPSTATLKNFQKNYCKAQYTRTKKVNKTLINFIKKLWKESFKMLVTLFFSQVKIGVAKQNPKPQPKEKERKSKKWKYRRGYISIEADGSASARIVSSIRVDGPTSAQTSSSICANRF
jgi:hypothetical protein